MTITWSAFKCFDNLAIIDPVVMVHTFPVPKSTSTASLVCVHTVHGEDEGSTACNSGNGVCHVVYVCSYVYIVQWFTLHNQVWGILNTIFRCIVSHTLTLVATKSLLLAVVCTSTARNASMHFSHKCTCSLTDMQGCWGKKARINANQAQLTIGFTIFPFHS